MAELFFDKPVLNSPYAYPGRHWELDAQGQPTQKIIEARRKAEFITPIPGPKKRGGQGEQASLIFGKRHEQQPPAAIETRHHSQHHTMQTAASSFEIVPMRTTVSLDEAVLDEARRITGLMERSALIREDLKALIERESARRLARPGGSEPQVKPVPRRRSPPA